MLTLKVLAALLVYPEQELIDSLDEMASILEAQGAVPRSERRALAALMADLRAADLLDAQARYVALFDHSRSLSLHLYEHSHGESRDRLPAAVFGVPVDPAGGRGAGPARPGGLGRGAAAGPARAAEFALRRGLPGS
jgi:hypothetical protein